eukprot:SRR837773.17400.p2 GENE.SRR837773.17400~~SRR837773.17400.p2  ORF type:complete len:138 (+),score=19.51 SRR837773.17400:45-416(+)
MGIPLPPGQVGTPAMAGLVTGGGGPPPPAAPPPGPPPPGPPPLQLEDPATQSAINDDVLKAINKLKAAAAAPPPGPTPTPPPAPPPPGGGAPPPPADAGMANDTDMVLQAEALKAIQALNASG